MATRNNVSAEDRFGVPDPFMEYVRASDTGDLDGNDAIFGRDGLLVDSGDQSHRGASGRPYALGWRLR